MWLHKGTDNFNRWVFKVTFTLTLRNSLVLPCCDTAWAGWWPWCRRSSSWWRWLSWCWPHPLRPGLDSTCWPRQGKHRPHEPWDSHLRFISLKVFIKFNLGTIFKIRLNQLKFKITSCKRFHHKSRIAFFLLRYLIERQPHLLRKHF